MGRSNVGNAIFVALVICALDVIVKFAWLAFQCAWFAVKYFISFIYINFFDSNRTT